MGSSDSCCEVFSSTAVLCVSLIQISEWGGTKQRIFKSGETQFPLCNGSGTHGLFVFEIRGLCTAIIFH